MSVQSGVGQFDPTELNRAMQNYERALDAVAARGQEAQSLTAANLPSKRNAFQQAEAACAVLNNCITRLSRQVESASVESVADLEKQLQDADELVKKRSRNVAEVTKGIESALLVQANVDSMRALQGLTVALGGRVSAAEALAQLDHALTGIVTHATMKDVTINPKDLLEALATNNIASLRKFDPLSESKIPLSAKELMDLRKLLLEADKKVTRETRLSLENLAQAQRAVNQPFEIVAVGIGSKHTVDPDELVMAMANQTAAKKNLEEIQAKLAVAKKMATLDLPRKILTDLEDLNKRLTTINQRIAACNPQVGRTRAPLSFKGLTQIDITQISTLLTNQHKQFFNKELSDLHALPEKRDNIKVIERMEAVRDQVMPGGSFTWAIVGSGVDEDQHLYIEENGEHSWIRLQVSPGGITPTEQGGASRRKVALGGTYQSVHDLMNAILQQRRVGEKSLDDVLRETSLFYKEARKRTNSYKQLQQSLYVPPAPIPGTGEKGKVTPPDINRFAQEMFNEIKPGQVGKNSYLILKDTTKRSGYLLYRNASEHTIGHPVRLVLNPNGTCTCEGRTFNNFDALKQTYQLEHRAIDVLTEKRYKDAIEGKYVLNRALDKDETVKDLSNTGQAVEGNWFICKEFVKAAARGAAAFLGRLVESVAESVAGSEKPVEVDKNRFTLVEWTKEKRLKEIPVTIDPKTGKYILPEDAKNKDKSFSSIEDVVRAVGLDVSRPLKAVYDQTVEQPKIARKVEADTREKRAAEERARAAAEQQRKAAQAAAARQQEKGRAVEIQQVIMEQARKDFETVSDAEEALKALDAPVWMVRRPVGAFTGKRDFTDAVGNPPSVVLSVYNPSKSDRKVEHYNLTVADDGKIVVSNMQVPLVFGRDTIYNNYNDALRAIVKNARPYEDVVAERKPKEVAAKPAQQPAAAAQGAVAGVTPGEGAAAASAREVQAPAKAAKSEAAITETIIQAYELFRTAMGAVFNWKEVGEVKRVPQDAQYYALFEDTSGERKTPILALKEAGKESRFFVLDFSSDPGKVKIQQELQNGHLVNVTPRIYESPSALENAIANKYRERLDRVLEAEEARQREYAAYIEQATAQARRVAAEARAKAEAEARAQATAAASAATTAPTVKPEPDQALSQPTTAVAGGAEAAGAKPVAKGKKAKKAQAEKPLTQDEANALIKKYLEEILRGGQAKTMSKRIQGEHEATDNGRLIIENAFTNALRDQTWLGYNKTTSDYLRKNIINILLEKTF